jgi:tetratricopeptide (TPR) repeat protein
MSSTLSSSKNGDEFVSGVNSFFEFLAKRARLFVALGVVVLIGSAIFAFNANRKSEKTDAGRNALYLAQKSLDTQLAVLAKAAAPAAPSTPASKGSAEKAAKPADPEVVAFQKMNVDTQFADAVGKFKAVAQDYGSTRPGLEAMLILGKLYLNHGEPQKAEEWFHQAVEHGQNGMDRASAWSNVGYADENQNKYKDSLDAFDKAVGMGEASLKGDLLLSKARVFEELKDNAQAKSTYEQIQSLLPNTEYAKLADSFKSRLK